MIRYRDNGKGMDQSQRANVFEAFFTTKREQVGSGLGIHIVYNLVTRTLRGQIVCESTPAIGTLFTIHMPFEPIKEMNHEETPQCR